MGNEVIEVLFEHFDGMLLGENPIETAEFTRALDGFCGKHFGRLELGAQSAAELELAELLNICKRSAFETGFKACVELLTR